MSIRVAVIDSGLGAGSASPVVAASAFVRTACGAVQRQAVQGDKPGHGSAVAALIAARAPCSEFIDAQVFVANQATDALVLAEAIDWSMAQGARLLNLSVGLLADRSPLRAACARAVAAGLIVVAASPARGQPSYPAAYPQVIAVCGDARCTEGDWTFLDGKPHMGAAPQALAPAAGGGASFAAARLCGFAAAFLSEQPQAGYADLLSHLHAAAVHLGRENRRRYA